MADGRLNERGMRTFVATIMYCPTCRKTTEWEVARDSTGIEYTCKECGKGGGIRTQAHDGSQYNG